jgi:hypothetical protein
MVELTSGRKAAVPPLVAGEPTVVSGAFETNLVPLSITDL